MQDARRRGNHKMEMAAPDGRARNPSSGADLSLSRNARRADSADIRAYFGTSARTKQRRVTFPCLRARPSRRREWGPAPLVEQQPSGREDQRPLDRAWRATDSV